MPKQTISSFLSIVTIFIHSVLFSIGSDLSWKWKGCINCRILNLQKYLLYFTWDFWIASQLLDSSADHKISWLLHFLIKCVCWCRLLCQDCLVLLGSSNWNPTPLCGRFKSWIIVNQPRKWLKGSLGTQPRVISPLRSAIFPPLFFVIVTLLKYASFDGKSYKNASRC